MPLPLHQITAPVFVRHLRILATLLQLGRGHADANGLSHDELLQAKLFPDMASLIGQIQRASDTARNTMVRVAQWERKAMDDTESTFDDLQARIVATIAYVEAVPPAAFDGKDAIAITMKPPGGELHFSGESYVLEFALPNFFFHVTTAYDILRLKGVPLGKADYLGWR